MNSQQLGVTTKTYLNSLECTSDQSTRAKLRSRFLHVISNLTGARKCTISMYDNTKVDGKVLAFDSSFENVIVEDLITPFPTPIQKAVLRTNDIISMRFVVTDVQSLE